MQVFRITMFSQEIFTIHKRTYSSKKSRGTYVSEIQTAPPESRQRAFTGLIVHRLKYRFFAWDMYRAKFRNTSVPVFLYLSRYLMVREYWHRISIKNRYIILKNILQDYKINVIDRESLWIKNNNNKIIFNEHNYLFRKINVL